MRDIRGSISGVAALQGGTDPRRVPAHESALDLIDALRRADSLAHDGNDIEARVTADMVRMLGRAHWVRRCNGRTIPLN